MQPHSSFGLGDDFVPEDTEQQMRERTNWGDLLSVESREEERRAAENGTERDRGWWRWRWWWPSW